MQREAGQKEFLVLRMCLRISKFTSKIYDVVCGGLKPNNEISIDIGYVLHQTSCQDSQIDELEWDIKVLIQKVDMIAEDV